jgi:hypothetical protein
MLRDRRGYAAVLCQQGTAAVEPLIVALCKIVDAD